MSYSTVKLRPTVTERVPLIILDMGHGPGTWIRRSMMWVAEQISGKGPRLSQALRHCIFNDALDYTESTKVGKTMLSDVDEVHARNRAGGDSHTRLNWHAQTCDLAESEGKGGKRSPRHGGRVSSGQGRAINDYRTSQIRTRLCPPVCQFASNSDPFFASNNDPSRSEGLGLSA
jgi:hypothetical protein